MGSPVQEPPPARLRRDSARVGRGLLARWALAGVPLLALLVTGISPAWSGDVYLPLHAAAEIAVALVGFATFAVQWYAARAGAGDARGRFIGSAFLGMGLLEIVHLLVFPGMPGVLGPSSVERGIYYWLLCRGWMIGALSAAAFVPPASQHRQLTRGPLLAWNLALVVGAVALERSGVVPHGLFFASETGLTAFKVGLELGLALVSALFAVLQFWRWRAEGERTLLQLAAALGLAALSEVALTLYQHPYDAYNLLGHVYALAAVALMFDGLFVAALLDPYRRLDAASRDLATSNAHLDALRAHVEGELATTISRLRETTAREQSARAALEAAFAAVPDAILVYSQEGRILHTNAAADRLFGYEEAAREETLLQRWTRLKAQTTEGKPLPIEENPLARALGGETAHGVPLAIETADGRRLWVSVSAAPIRVPDRRLEGAVAAVADLGTLQRLQAQREDLLRAVSHDLRNPLQVILLQAERLQQLLSATPLEKERTSAARIAYAAKQMGVMIRDLVEAVRMESGGLTLLRQPVELRQLVERVLGQAAGVLDVARVAVDLPAELPPLDADPARLERVVLNLIGNALKYSPETTQVRVSAVARGDRVQVSVTDEGIGIAPEDVEHVFERFYRGQRTQKSDGLGLGLYIVQLLVEAHGGRVWVESKPGQGSTFTFSIPVATRRPG